MKLAIIGTGFIATEMMEAIRDYGAEIEVVTVYNRTQAKAEQFATTFGIQHVSHSYEEALAQPIDAVYLAVHTNDHYRLTKQALEHGLDVLCEKPAVLNQFEFSQLADLAQKQGCFWMDAMRFIHLPIWTQIKQLIAEGIIGDIVYVDGSLGRISQRLYRHTRELAGGVLYDLAIYPLYAIIDLLGLPTTTSVQALMLPSGVDHTVSGQLHYEGAIAHFMASCVSQTQTHLRIQGTKGTIMIANEFTTNPIFTVTNEQGVVTTHQSECLGNGMIYELRAFMAKTAPQQVSEDVYTVLTAMRHQLGMSYPNEQIEGSDV